jgi:hypothetical protein
MQNHAAERGISIMAVAAPTAGAQVDLDISRFWIVVADLDQRLTEIRSTLNAVEPGMKNANRAAIDGPQFIAEKALMKPDGLEQPFGW